MEDCKKNVKLDDIVLLVDKMAERENWRMCRITGQLVQTLNTLEELR